MGSIAAALAKAWAIFEEIAPVAQVAVAVVQASAPAGTTGAAKYAAAATAINSAVTAASASATAFTNTKAAIASGDSATVAVATSNAIETVLSVFKTFNIFPKAAVVQSATDLSVMPENPPG